MTISCLQGGKTIAQLSGGTKTNLEIQKILYFANVFYIGKNGNKEPLVDRNFLTWRFGPAVKHLYDHIKKFGNGKVPVSAFDDIADIMNEKEEPLKGFEREVNVIKKAYERYKKYPAHKLVAISHWEGGAWAATIGKGEEVISNTAIWNEYNDRYGN